MFFFLTRKSQEKQHHALVMGMTAGDDGTARTLTDQLTIAKNETIAASTAQKQATMRATHMTKSADAKRPAAKKMQDQHSAMMKDVDVVRKVLSTLETELAVVGHNQEALVTLEKKQASLQQQRTEVRDKCDSLTARLGHIEFSYSDPVPGFNRSKVHGLVAELVTIKVHSFTLLLPFQYANIISCVYMWYFWKFILLAFYL